MCVWLTRLGEEKIDYSICLKICPAADPHSGDSARSHGQGESLKTPRASRPRLPHFLCARHQLVLVFTLLSLPWKATRGTIMSDTEEIVEEYEQEEEEEEVPPQAQMQEQQQH